MLYTNVYIFLTNCIQDTNQDEMGNAVWQIQPLLLQNRQPPTHSSKIIIHLMIFFFCAVLLVVCVCVCGWKGELELMNGKSKRWCSWRVFGMTSHSKMSEEVNDCICLDIRQEFCSYFNT
jgi:hypothetical protein